MGTSVAGATVSAATTTHVDGTIARMLERIGGPDEPAEQQEMHARLEVREIGHRHEQLAAPFEHAMQFRQGLGLSLIGQVLEHIEAKRAGKRAAAVMSLVHSARLNGHDPYAYLRDVLERLPTQPASRVAELLPHRWSASNTN